MNFGTQASLRASRSSDASMLKQQLEKEVMCLVDQLDRVRRDESVVDSAMLKNYETMIQNRRKMLHNLPIDSTFKSVVGCD